MFDNSKVEKIILRRKMILIRMMITFLNEVLVSVKIADMEYIVIASKTNVFD